MTVPLNDIRGQYQSLKPAIDEALGRVIESASFVGGREISAFEDEFASYCEAPQCVGVGNGTDALTLTLNDGTLTLNGAFQLAADVTSNAAATRNIMTTPE